MIKVVIFDADGVAIIGEKFSNNLARDFGITTEITKSFFTGPFQDCRIGRADLKEVITPYLGGWGWKGSVEELLEYWFKSEHKINQDLIDYVRELRGRGIQCFLATNQEKYRTQYMLNEMDFAKIFDRLYVSSELGVLKTNPEFYAKIIEDLGDIDKKEILFWDDDPKHIEVAKNYGILGEAYTSFADCRKKTESYL